MLSDDLSGAEFKKKSRGNDDDQHVVQLAYSGNEIRKKIEGHNEIKKRRREDQLRRQRDPWILHQPSEQLDQSWQMANELDDTRDSEPLKNSRGTESHVRLRT